MRKKDLVFYVLILVLAVILIRQWTSNSSLQNQINLLQKYNSQMQFLLGIGQLGSTHIHADVKVYINGQSVDFSQHKYQLATSFIHFEDGLGDVIHVHATKMTLGQLFKSLRGELTANCVSLDGQRNCNENASKLRFYVNGKQNSEFGDYVISDLDKILVSYGSENESEIQKQLDSITNLAPKYSADGGIK